MSQDGESGYKSKLKSIKTTHGSYVLYEADHRLRFKFLDFYRDSLSLASDEKTGKFECPLCKQESTRAGGRASDNYFTCTISNENGSGRCETEGCEYFFSGIIDWWSKFSDDVDYSKFKHETLEEIVTASNLDLKKFSKFVAPRLGAGWDGDVLRSKHYAETSKNMGSDDPLDVVEKGNAAIRKLTGKYQDWYAHAFGFRLAPNGKMVCPNVESHPKKSDSVTLELDRNTGNARCTVCDIRFSPQRLWHRYAQFTIAFNSYVRLGGSYRAYVLEIIDKMKEAIPDESLSVSDTDNPVQFDAPSKDTASSKSSSKATESKRVYVINGDEAFMDEEQRKIMFSTVYNILNNGFHEFYKSDFGLKQAANKNFHCFNTNAHKHGDKMASLSINNANGLGNCKACGLSFNLISLFTEYGTMTSAASYHTRFEGKITPYLMHRFNLMPKDTVMDFTGAAQILDQMNMSGSDCMSGEDLKNMVSKMKSDPSMMDNRDVSSFVESAKKMSIEEGYAIDPYASHVMDEKSSLAPLIEALHKDKDSLSYLESTRGVSADVLKALKIGLYRNGAFAIPLFTEDGRLINIKKYHPRNADRKFKWAYQEQGKPAMAFPYAALSPSKIYIVEGETDVICMYAHGFEAVTFGASVNTNMVRILNGAKNVERFFKDKEVFIIPDKDAAGEKFASSMSNAIREYAKQIKIVDLDVSGADWTPLDPSKKNADGKRIEKDVTDFLKKNGFGSSGKNALESLIGKLNAEKTPDHTLSGISSYNLSLAECSKTKYMDTESVVVVHTSGIISAVDQKSTILSEITAYCPIDDVGFKKMPQCHGCKMSCAKSCASGGKVFKALTPYEQLLLKILQDQGITPDYAPKMTDNIVDMDDHEQLNMINEVDQKKIPQFLKASKINRACPHLITKIKKNINVSCTVLSNDYSDPLEKIRFGSNATDTIKAYIKTHETLEVGRPYKITGIATTNVNGIPSLMVYDLKSKKPMNAYFEMTDDINSMISHFKKPDNVSVTQHLLNIGKMINDEAGVTGRDLAALMGALTVLSPNILPFEELLPGITKGQMQGLVMGDTRCAKSLIIKKIIELFCEGRVEYIGCNSSTSRTGLIGSIVSSGNEVKIVWGAIPKANGGVVVLDESHQLDPKVLTDMNNIRSEGLAEITKSKQGIAEARVQMMFIANERPDSQGNIIEFSHKLDSIFHYAGGDKTVISRFDWVIYMESDDVKVFNSVYDPRPAWFNKNSCKALRAWSQSIKEWDMDRKEIHERIQYWFNHFRDKYDFSSVLINQEMRAKLARLVCSIAILCGERSKHNLSVPRITIEHVDAAAELYELLYSGEKVHTNLNLKKYADMNRTGVNIEEIDLDQLNSLLYFCDVKSMIRSNDITVSQIDVAFAHYTQLVERGLAYTPMEKGGRDLRTTEVRSYSVAKVIMGYLLNCGLVVHSSGIRYRKTKEFTRILINIMENSSKPKDQQIELRPDALMVNKLLSADDVIKKVNNSTKIEFKSIGTIQKKNDDQVVTVVETNINQAGGNVSTTMDTGAKSTSSKLSEARRRLIERRQQ